MISVRDQVVIMGDPPAQWKAVVERLKRDPRLTTVQKIEDGEGSFIVLAGKLKKK